MKRPSTSKGVDDPEILTCLQKTTPTRSQKMDKSASSEGHDDTNAVNKGVVPFSPVEPVQVQAKVRNKSQRIISTKIIVFLVVTIQFFLGCIVNSANINTILMEYKTSSDSDDIYFTFPSPQERIKYYMGKWFDDFALNKESCADISIANTSTADLADTALLYTQELLNATLEESPDGRLNRYQRDALKVLNSFKPKETGPGAEINNNVLIRFGDHHDEEEDLPVVSKAREIGADNEKGIIWPLNIIRHFGKLDNLKKTQDIPWEEKKEAIVWRGVCTGDDLRLNFVENFAPQQNDDIDIFFIPHNTCEIQNVDAKLTKPTINMEDMLKYKYLLSLEGNDVASGLKWQLASSSVVFMPKPTAETYAMEGLLVPFVHYIPVKSDGSDVKDMMAWAKKNDKRARWISEQASIFMDKLWIGHEAQENNNFIYGELAKIYHEKFSDILQECFIQREKV